MRWRVFNGMGDFIFFLFIPVCIGLGLTVKNEHINRITLSLTLVIIYMVLFAGMRVKQGGVADGV